MSLLNDMHMGGEKAKIFFFFYLDFMEYLVSLELLHTN